MHWQLMRTRSAIVRCSIRASKNARTFCPKQAGLTDRRRPLAQTPPGDLDVAILGQGEVVSSIRTGSTITPATGDGSTARSAPASALPLVNPVAGHWRGLASGLRRGG